MEQNRAPRHEGALDKRTLITRTADASESSISTTARPIRVLVADDQDMMRELLSMSLQRLGYSVTVARNGKEALELFYNTPFDLLLLDVVMPEMTGFDVCAAVRQFSDVPIIMLTALNRPEDVVNGLDHGADNYITKPFSFKEVEAKIQAIVRRTFFPSELTNYSILEEGDLWLNTETQEVKLAGVSVELTPIEFGLLYWLTLHANLPVSKEELLEKVWPEDSSDNLNIVELAVRRLRTKIEEDVADPQRVITVRGFGYRLNTLAASPSSQPSSMRREADSAAPSHRLLTEETRQHNYVSSVGAKFNDGDTDTLMVKSQSTASVVM
jgi:DNA-binding response OmpR family regulator